MAKKIFIVSLLILMLITIIPSSFSSIFQLSEIVTLTTNTSGVPKNITFNVTLIPPDWNYSQNFSLTTFYSSPLLKGPTNITMNGSNKTITLELKVPENISVGNHSFIAYFYNNSIGNSSGNTGENFTYNYTVLIYLEHVNASYLIDEDNDSFVQAYDCNDTNPLQNPNMSEIFYNGIDDDCNASTEDFHNFTISLNKNSYNLGEEMQIKVYAPPSSNITLEFCSQPDENGWSYCYYPHQYIQEREYETILKKYTNKSGSYTLESIMRYNNMTLTQTINYEIRNSILIQVEGERVIKENESTTLTASATGGIGRYTFKWKKHDGSIVNGNQLTLGNLTPGTYNETIIVEDSEGNKKEETVSVVVKKLYNVNIRVINSQTNETIPNVSIVFDFGKELVTNSNGIATIKLVSGTYRITVSHENFESTTKSFEVNKDETIIVKLDVKDTYAPRISLIEPANGNETEGKEVKFKFEVEDENKVSCSLFLSDGNTLWFREKYNISKVDPGVYETTLTLEPKVYLWQVECRDIYGNIGESEVWNFEVIEHKEVNYIEESIYDLIESSIEEIDNLDAESKKAAQLMKLKNKLSKAEIELKEINRDLNDIKFRRDLSDEEKEKKKQELLKKKDLIIKNTIKIINVENSKTFIKYVEEGDLQKISSMLKNEIGNSKDEKDIIELLRYLQNKIYVETTYYVGKIETLEGEEKEITLIHKKFKVNGSGVKNQKILEYFPKEVVEDASKIEIIESPEGYSIINQDPLLSFPINEEEGEIIYYVTNKLSEREIKEVKSVFFGNTILPKKKSDNFLTGFVSFDINNITIDYKKSAIIVAILVIVLFLLVNGSLLSLPFLANKKEKYIQVLIYDALDHLDAGEVKKANLLYKEIKMIYDELSYHSKKRVYEKIQVLYNKINEVALKKALEEIQNAKDNEKYNWAKLIVASYSRLPEEIKSKYSGKVKEILKRFEGEK